jgi:hypothetical protein
VAWRRDRQLRRSGVGSSSPHWAGHRRGHGRGQRRLEVHVETDLACPH